MSIEFKVSGLTTKQRQYTPVELGPEFQIIPGPRGRGRRFLLVSDGKAAFEIVAPGKTRDQLLAEHEDQQRDQQEEKTKTHDEPLRKTDEVEIATRISM